MAKDKTISNFRAMVHVDVKGYSRLMGEDDEYTVRTLGFNCQEIHKSPIVRLPLPI